VFLVLYGALLVLPSGALLMLPSVVVDLHHYFAVDCHPRPQQLAMLVPIFSKRLLCPSDRNLELSR
jgi:hypothetical protein